MPQELTLHRPPDAAPDLGNDTAQASAVPTRPPVPAPLLIGRDELARLLDVGTASVDRLRAAGRVPAPIRLGGSVRWHRAEIEAWLAKRGPNGDLLDAKQWSAIRDQVLAKWH